MKRTHVIATVAIAAITQFAHSSPARADDLALFSGLVPGQPIVESELSKHYGKGMSQLVLECTGGTCVYAPDGNTFSQNVNLNGTLNSNSGITSNQQFAGDNNQVSVTVAITVNINTVTVQDSAGSAVSVSQSLDFGGGVVQGFAP